MTSALISPSHTHSHTHRYLRQANRVKLQHCPFCHLYLGTGTSAWRVTWQLCRAKRRPRKDSKSFFSGLYVTQPCLCWIDVVPGVIRVSLVIVAIGRNYLIFKRANSQEEPVLADSNSSGENRCRGDETRDKHCHYRGSGELKTRLNCNGATLMPGITSCHSQLRPSSLILCIKTDVQEPPDTVQLWQP